MDYPLGGVLPFGVPLQRLRLNPYSNGLPSRGEMVNLSLAKTECLNPYSNGLPSRGRHGTATHKVL